MTRTLALWLMSFSLVVAACTSTPPPPEDMLPPETESQLALTRIFDEVMRNDARSAAAAQRGAQGDESSRRFLNSLWGTRTGTPEGAESFAREFAKARHDADSVAWYQRAYEAYPAGHARRPHVRLELARVYLDQGKNDLALDLLANRLGVEPLPSELAREYDAVIRRAGGR